MTVSELFKKYDFESILPHLNHLFMVNSGRHFTDASIEVFRGLLTSAMHHPKTLIEVEQELLHLTIVN